jgi:hypothetical protein
LHVGGTFCVLNCCCCCCLICLHVYNSHAG